MVTRPEPGHMQGLTGAQPTDPKTEEPRAGGRALGAWAGWGWGGPLCLLYLPPNPGWPSAGPLCQNPRGHSS